MARRGIDVAATAALLAALVCWSVVPLVLRYLTDVVPDGFTTNAVRYPISALFYVPWLAAALRDRASRRLFLLAIVPTIPNVVGQTLFAWAPYYIEPGLMSFVLRLSVVWGMAGALLAFPAERQLLRSPRFWGGAVLSLAGFAAVAAGSGATTQKATFIGLVIAVACSFFWGVYVVAARATIGRANPLTVFAIVCTYTSIGCLLVAPLGEPSSLLHLAMPKLLLLVASGLVGIAAAHGLYYIALQKLGAMIPSAVNALTPFVTAAASSVLLDESIAGIQWFGGFVSLGGTAMIIWSQEDIQPAETQRPDGPP